MLTRLLIVMALCLSLPVFAQTTAGLTNGQTAAVTSSNSASVAPGAVSLSFQGAQAASPVTASRLDGFTEFHTNQAVTAPTIVGGTAPAQGGCPAIDGVTGSIAIAQFGTTTAKELPGCMANWLAEAFGRLSVKGDGTWTDASVMKLEAWCDFAQYKRIIERTKRYTCASTLEERAQQALNDQPAQRVTVASTSDPIIRERLERTGAR